MSRRAEKFVRRQQDDFAGQRTIKKSGPGKITPSIYGTSGSPLTRAGKKQAQRMMEQQRNMEEREKLRRQKEAERTARLLFETCPEAGTW